MSKFVPSDSLPKPIGETRVFTATTPQGIAKEAMRYGIELGWAYATLTVQTIRNNHDDPVVCEIADAICQALDMANESGIESALASVDSHLQFVPGANVEGGVQ